MLIKTITLHSLCMFPSSKGMNSGRKIRYKSAYHRVSLYRDTEEKCSIMNKEFALPSLHYSFRGSPCSNEFCAFSELCTDLANDLLHATD